MWKVSDPTPSPTFREVAVDPLDRLAGSFKVAFRAVPWGKFISLLTEYELRKNWVATVSRRGSVVAPQTEAELTEQLQAFQKEAEQADSNFLFAIKHLVAWGVADFADIVQPSGEPYLVNVKDEMWAGVKYQVLDKATLDLFLRLGVLHRLCDYVVSFHAGNLPETLDGFYEDKPESPPTPDGA